MNKQNLREISSRIINEVSHGKSLSDCLAAVLSTNYALSPRDRAFVQAVCYGVCRYYPRLDVVLSYLLKKPMKAKDSDIHALLMVGLFQLMEMRVPSHAAVAETVAAVGGFNKLWARGLVNAVLREYLRTKQETTEKMLSDDEANYAHPAWWLRAVQTEWPKQWQAILQANNKQPPFALRINQRQFARDAYLAMLEKQGLSARLLPHTQCGIILDTAIPANELPGFLQGAISVQDGAAQLAGELLELQPGLRVLDACAAPGGKLTHVLEIEPHLAACVALEKDAKRMELIKDNLQRLQFSAQCFCDDVRDVSHWWDGQLFDRILLDVPCSASGVVRRHPDIKLLRQPKDIPAFAEVQRQLLDSVWPLLKTNGVLLYVTCSIFSAENTEVIKYFLTKHADANLIDLPSTLGVACEVGRQILPGMDEMDGFYYAKLQKR